MFKARWPLHEYKRGETHTRTHTGSDEIRVTLHIFSTESFGVGVGMGVEISYDGTRTSFAKLLSEHTASDLWSVERVPADLPAAEGCSGHQPEDEGTRDVQ